MGSLYPVLYWNNARLIIIILNALFGLHHYYEGHISTLEANEILALRIIQGCASYLILKNGGRDRSFLVELRLLYSQVNETAFRALLTLKERNIDQYNKYYDILAQPYNIFYGMLESNKMTLNGDRSSGLDESSETLPLQDRCLLEFASSIYKKCQLTEYCLRRILRSYPERRSSNHVLLYLAFAIQGSCKSKTKNYLDSANETFESIILKYCNRRAFKQQKIVSAAPLHGTEQISVTRIFECGQYGIFDGSALYQVLSLIRQQDPDVGCFPIRQKANAKRNVRDDTTKCSTHWSYAGAMAVSLIFSSKHQLHSTIDDFGDILNELNVFGNTSRSGRWLHNSEQFIMAKSSQVLLLPPFPPSLPYFYNRLNGFTFLLFVAFLFFILFFFRRYFLKQRKPLYRFAYKNL